MRMEGGGCNGSLTSLVQEAGVRFDAGELSAFEVEDLNSVIASAAVQSLEIISKAKQIVNEGENLHSKYWEMFMCTCCS
jgi:hypothetical protein